MIGRDNESRLCSVSAKLFYFQKLDILFGQAVLYTRESKKFILLF